MTGRVVEAEIRSDELSKLNGAQRAARGKAARGEAPRTSYGDWMPAPDRRDPVALLEEQAMRRVPELLPIRYGRMAAGPFAFYRGGANVMAADLVTLPNSGLLAQLCGDAHLSNFGGFASPDRQLIFDANDFDETLPGPWEWDVLRLAASVEVAGREQGIDRKVLTGAVTAAVARYREAMRAFAAMTNLDVWYARLDPESALARNRQLASAPELEGARRVAQKARHKDSLRALAKLTQQVDGEPRFRSDPPLLVPARELTPGEDVDLFEASQALLSQYRDTLRGDLRHLIDQYRLVDVARKVVGVGSVGTRTWVALLLGRDLSDPLFLQLKEADASVLEPFVGRSRFGNHGRRVVEGQWLMQAASDILLGWLHTTGPDGVESDYYVRQLWDWKASVEVEALGAQALTVYAQMCAWTLARAHARSGDEIAIAAYLGSGNAFDRAVARFSQKYADQNERDYHALLDAIAAERLPAQTGV
jgi:uncharacterized protein (DUF2252 family)